MNKYSIGDWVVFTPEDDRHYCAGEILQITNIDERGFCTFRNYNKLYHTRLLTLWKPKHNEWCWFNNHETLEDSLTLGRFQSMRGSCYSAQINSKEDRLIITFFCCEPFVGELPSFVKNKG